MLNKNRTASDKSIFSMNRRRREALHGLMFISPWILGLALFFLYPFLHSLYLSVVNVENMSEFNVSWVGLKNYIEVLQGDTWYIRHFLTTIKNMSLQTPLINIFALFIAVLLNRNFPGRSLYRTLFFLPVILGAGFAMQQMLGTGVQDDTIAVAGNILLPQQIRIYLGPDATSFVWGFLSLMTTVLWKSGVQIVIYLSGLQSISKSLYEAARVDAATEWEMFWLITLPMITPMILLNLIYSVVDCFININDLLFRHIYNVAFQQSEFELSSAMSWMFILWVAVLVAIIFLVMRPFVNRVKE